MKAENFKYHSDPYVIIWKCEKSRMFTVKSIYSHIVRNDLGPYMKHIWKSKIPPNKIKVFMWFLESNVLLTKDNNLIRKNWNGDASCCFCEHVESVDHPFSIALSLE
jgi:hypothetical protein